jgi:hypothetical protein
MKNAGAAAMVIVALLAALCRAEQPVRIMENLGRGVVAVRNSSGAFVSWRLLGTELADIGFNLYRSTAGGAAVKVNGSVLTGATCYTDTAANLNQNNTYHVRAVVNGMEQAPSDAFTLEANTPVEPLLRIPLSGGNTDQIHFVWVGDLDGCGEYEFVVDRINWAGRPQKVEAYSRTGTRLWQVDLGPNSTNTNNIEPGSATIDVGHWDGVTVYDLDCDGKAEVVIRTANGVTFGDGRTLVHSNNNVQFISVLDGMTGAERARMQIPTDYIADGPMAAQMGIGYLNGRTPSIIASMKNRIGSGAFNMMICAWDFDGLSLTQKWKWRRGSGNYPDGHNLRIVDVDGDGLDEIGHIGFILKGDGTVLYNLASTGGVVHGDRWHIGKFDSVRPGLQGYGIQQDNPSGLLEYYYDAATGAMLWQRIGTPGDVARGDVGDVDPSTPGFECWAFNGVWNLPTRTRLSTASPWPVLRLWWDGDDLSESYNDGKIEKWIYSSSSVSRLVTTWNFNGATGSDRGAPMFYGDILGDWREEVILTNANYTALNIFTTSSPTSRRLYTLPHNPAYRNCMTVKGYMQSHHLDYYLGHGMTTPPKPAIELVNLDAAPPQPNPMTWDVEPYESGPGEIAMTAVTAIDDGSDVQYYFQCVTDSRRDSGWQNSPVYVDAGITRLVSRYRVKARDTSSNLNETEWSEEVTEVISTYPYDEQARSIPDMIQAEHFDVGGPNVTYYDITEDNAGGSLRLYEDVDIVAVTDGQAGFAIDHIETGEWLIYTVNSSAAQTDFYARVASTQPGGQIQVWLDDVLMATVDVPNTGSLTAWQTVSTSCLPLPERENAALKLAFVGTGFRLNWFQFGSQLAYLGVPSAIPGRIQLEDYDIGGQFIAYYDLTATNGYGQYRPSEQVDIMFISTQGVFAPFIQSGEWLECTCHIDPGTYTMTIRSSSPFTAQQFSMSKDGQTLAAVTLPNTGNFAIFQNTAVSNVYLPGGEQVLRFTMHASSALVDYVDFIRQYNVADITQTGRVDLDVFAVVAGQWVGVPGVPSVDIAPLGGDGAVDLLDLMVLAENWLSAETQ